MIVTYTFFTRPFCTIILSLLATHNKHRHASLYATLLLSIGNALSPPNYHSLNLYNLVKEKNKPKSITHKVVFFCVCVWLGGWGRWFDLFQPLWIISVKCNFITCQLQCRASLWQVIGKIYENSIQELNQINKIFQLNYHVYLNGNLKIWKQMEGKTLQFCGHGLGWHLRVQVLVVEAFSTARVNFISCWDTI